MLQRPRWALAIVDGDRLLKVLVGGEGSRDPQSCPLVGHDEPALQAWARSLHVDAAIVLDRRVAGELSAEIEGALRPDMDGVVQSLVALRAIKRHAGRGIWTLPAILELLPTPAYEPIQRTFDLLIPDNSAVLAYVIEDDRSRIHASLIAVKSGGDITEAATHRAIADLVAEPAFARDWKKGSARVLSAVEERFAKPAIGLFVERSTLMRILTGPSDQLARELNAKNLVIDPAPAWLLGLLGGAAVAAMAGRAASALASMLPASARERAQSFAQRAGAAMKESGAHPFALLGFDPLELWARLKHFYRD